MIAIIIWTIVMRKKSLIWWSIGIIALIVLNLAFYPSLRDQTAQLEQSFAEIPEAMRGFLSDTGEFLTPIGYLSSQVYYLMLPLLLSVFTITLASSLIGKEERDGTLEVIATKSISRTRLLVGKIIGGIICHVFVSAIALATILIAARIVNLPIGVGPIILATVFCFLFSLLIGMTALCITTLGRARAASVGVASFLAIGGYILSSLQPFADWLTWPAKLFPFNYYRPGEILSGTFSISDMFVLLLATSILIFVSIRAFRRRDIMV